MNAVTIKKFARELGATISGVASVDRFEGAPKGHAPQDLLPGARSVVVVGLKLLDRVVDWPSLFEGSEVMQGSVRQLVAQNHVYMGSGYRIVNRRLEEIALRIAYYLEEGRYKSMFFPATYADDAGIMEQVEGYQSPFSHRHAAVRAGLGEFGLNNLVVTREYGPRIRFNSIITTAPLVADPLLTQKVCLGENCAICVKECKTRALSQAVNYLPEGVWLTSPIPVDKQVCMKKHGEMGCIGTCLRVCPVGRK